MGDQVEGSIPVRNVLLALMFVGTLYVASIGPMAYSHAHIVGVERDWYEMPLYAPIVWSCDHVPGISRVVNWYVLIFRPYRTRCGVI